MTDVLEEVTEALGKGPAKAEIRKLVDDRVVRSPFDLEKWLFNWELHNVEIQDRPSPGSDHDSENAGLWGISGWGDEIEPRTVSLFLLPTPHSWQTLAYLNWWGASTIGTTVVMSFLKEWQQKYGAELVCHFGMSLRFKLPQRPVTITEAFQIACEHYSLAPYTRDAAGALLRTYAESLLLCDGWELHEGH